MPSRVLTAAANWRASSDPRLCERAQVLRMVRAVSFPSSSRGIISQRPESKKDTSSYRRPWNSPAETSLLRTFLAKAETPSTEASSETHKRVSDSISRLISSVPVSSTKYLINAEVSKNAGIAYRRSSRSAMISSERGVLNLRLICRASSMPPFNFTPAFSSSSAHFRIQSGTARFGGKRNCSIKASKSSAISFSVSCEVRLYSSCSSLPR